MESVPDRLIWKPSFYLAGQVKKKKRLGLKTKTVDLVTAHCSHICTTVFQLLNLILVMTELQVASTQLCSSMAGVATYSAVKFKT